MSNLSNVHNLIRAAGDNGKFFTVKFVKRSTGELRTMNCRLGVTKHLKGGTKSYNDKDHKLVTVYDLKSEGYRCIALEGVTEVNGQPV